MVISFAEGCEETWIIGGAGTYAAMFDKVDEIHLTTIHAQVEGDVTMPEWDKNGWKEEVIERREKSEEDQFPSTYSIWRKI